MDAVLKGVLRVDVKVNPPVESRLTAFAAFCVLAEDELVAVPFEAFVDVYITEVPEVDDVANCSPVIVSVWRSAL